MYVNLFTIVAILKPKLNVITYSVLIQLKNLFGHDWDIF